MIYTHTFTLQIDGITVAGEMAFSGGQVHIKTRAGEEMTVDQHGRVQALLEAIKRLAACCEDEIRRIEIAKK